MGFLDAADTTGTALRVCCGPRCGAEPGHRRIYAALETAAAAASLTVRPMMCQSLCGGGVTVALPDGTKRKARDAAEARALLALIPTTDHP